MLQLLVMMSLCYVKGQIATPHNLSIGTSFIPSEDPYFNVNGSPYLNDEWGKGFVKLNDGESYRNIDIKFDELKQQVVIKGENELTYKFVDPVKEFNINYVVDGNVHKAHFIRGYGDNKNVFYEILADGSLLLLKSTDKKINSIPSFPAGSERSKAIQNTNDYFIVKDGKLLKIKPDEKSVLKAIGNNEAELSTYIKSNNLVLKHDADLVNLIVHYNSI